MQHFVLGDVVPFEAQTCQGSDDTSTSSNMGKCRRPLQQLSDNLAGVRACPASLVLLMSHQRCALACCAGLCCAVALLAKLPVTAGLLPAAHLACCKYRVLEDRQQPLVATRAACTCC